MTMKTTLPMLSLVASLGAAAAGCGSDNPAQTGGTGGTGGSGGSAMLTSYVPFATANMTEQQARVAAYEQIRTIRRNPDFSAADFGDLAATSPTGTTIADIYTHIGGLRQAVVGRIEEHTYGTGVGTDALGLEMDALIAEAITAGAAGTRIAVQGQIIEKTLLRFFYESVYHELIARGAPEYDEAFAYSGFALDGDPATAKGLAATAKARDDRFATAFHDGIFSELLKGKAALDARFAGATPGTVAEGELPALEAVITEIDRQLLIVFAYSTGYELVDLAGAADPAVVLAEARMYFNVVEDYMASRDAAGAAFIRAQLDGATYDAPTALDAAGMVQRIEQTFGIDVTP